MFPKVKQTLSFHWVALSEGFPVATEREQDQMGPLVSTLHSYFCITVAKIPNSYSLKKERLIWAQHFRVVHATMVRRYGGTTGFMEVQVGSRGCPHSGPVSKTGISNNVLTALFPMT